MDVPVLFWDVPSLDLDAGHVGRLYAGMPLRSHVRRLIRRATGFDVHAYQPALDFFADAAHVLGADAQIIAFDVGANRGQSIAKIWETFPNVTIHAFEPSPANFKVLAQIKHRRLRLNPCGVGSVKGHLTLNESDDMSSFLETGRDGWGQVNGQTTVPIVTIDDYCAEHSIETIDLLKIDTQGFDLEVLKGASRLLAGKNVRLILVEICLAELYRGQPRIDDVLGHLIDHGYSITGVYDQHRINGVLGWADVGFIAPGQRPPCSSGS